MTYRFLDHTADVGADLEAPDLADLYAEAAAALTDTITDRRTVGTGVERRVGLAADSGEELMVDWLEELLYLFETDGLLVHHAEVELVPEPDGGSALRLSAVLHGETHDPSRHPHKVLVKAITWHALHLTPTAGGWTGRILFDV